MFRSGWCIFVKRCIAIFLFTAVMAVSLSASAAGAVAEKKISRGVWVSVFSAKRVLFSKKSAMELVLFCAKNGIDTIYLQIYRAGEAWYDSRLAGRGRYTAMVAAAGSDPIDFLISEARRRGIKVYGWMNILCLAQNEDAPIVMKYGKDILTRDQRQRLPLRYNKSEDQLFLEPGDERVVRYTLSLVGEVMARYPSLSGLHLDYIRYPKAIPASGFLFLQSPGLSYGFTERNVARFRLATGKNPWKNPWSKEWDAWKKRQISGLTEKIRAAVKKGAPGWKLSSAVVPSAEKASSLLAQEWPGWIRRGTVDYVVLMNYTTDEHKFIETARQAQVYGPANRIHVGIGAYMLKNKKEVLRREFQRLEALRPGGIVFFSYDDICRKGTCDVLSGYPQARQIHKVKKAKKKK